MSVMTRGIISQPFTLAMHSDYTRRQFYSHAQVLLAESDRLLKLLERTVEQHVPLTELEGVPGWSRVVELVDVVAERDQLRAEAHRLTMGMGMQVIKSFSEHADQKSIDELLAAGIQVDKEEISRLRAEVAGLRTGYEAYEQVNAELKAENERLERNRDMWKGQVERQAEELTALREEVTEWKDTVKFNEGCWSEERGTMIDKLQESRMRIKELDLLFGRHILAMRSALIEEEHGKGPAAAMEWIYNSLAGPGELPPEGETDSQAYFDREIVAVDNGMQDVMAFHEGRRAAMGKGEQS